MEASEIVSEQVSKEAFKGQFKATMMRYRFSNTYLKSSEGLKNHKRESEKHDIKSSLVAVCMNCLR